MINSQEHLVWLNIADPTEEDAALLRDEFGFHPLAIEDAIQAHQRAKVDIYDTYYFIVFYTASFQAEENRIETQALNLFIGANYLISVYWGDIPQVAATMARWQIPYGPSTNRIGMLVHALLDAIVDDYFPVIDCLADRLEDLEDAIFEENQTDSIQQIFEFKKELLSLRRTLTPGRDVLNVLLRRELAIFKSKDMAYLQDVYDHIVRVTDSIDIYRELLSSALDSYLSIQSNKLNQIVKVLTLASIILMSNALIAGIYGMNFEFMPELTWPWGYPFALGLMLVISGALVWYFRHKKLL